MSDIKNILFAEDNANDIELTLAALGEHNLANRVTVVRDGAEALDFLYHRGAYQSRENGNPCVILLDLKMPKMDGFQVLKTIRADSQLKMIPVVVLTSSREEKDLVESYKFGVNAYVVKPVNFQKFIDAVKKLGVFWALINEPPPGSVKK